MLKQFETKILEDVFDFVQQQDMKVRKKILQNIRRAEMFKDPKFFKKLNNEIWEFRTLYNGNQYRILAFWDKENQKETLVLATHRFVKKTSKVGRKEINKAEMIRLRYLKNKEQ